MNIVDLVEIKYPGQIEAGNVDFRNPDGRILINSWNIPDVSRPTEDELELEITDYEAQHNLNIMKTTATLILENLINSKVNEREYKDAVSCASYFNSTNPQWAAEAQAFVAWRDACYQYAYQLFADIEAGGSIPNEQDFITGIPVIIWP